jgi:hypothetical protein
MQGYKIADWGNIDRDLVNSAGNALFKNVVLKWSRPTLWTKDMKCPKFDTDQPFVYALIRNHGKASTKDRIEYVGLTNKPAKRFDNHPTAHAIVNKRGSVQFTYAPIDFITGKNRIKRIGQALEEIEHLLIWTLYDNLENRRKLYTLPGMGTNPGNAWHIHNEGYRFSGQMPREIVYPWMLVKPGRNRTAKS